MSKILRFQMFLLDNMIWIILIVFFLINVFITPRFFSYANIVNIAYYSTILGLLVLGQGLVLITGNLDLSSESTLAFAPGIAMLLAMSWIPGGLDPITGIIMTLAIGALVGLFNGFCIAKVGINAFLQTLSMLIILRGLTLYILPFSITPLDPIYIWAGRARTFGNIPVAIIIVLIIFVIFYVIMKHTTFGRHLVATGGNPQASFVAGINTINITMWAFTLAGLLAAAAGILTAGQQGAISNTMGRDLILMVFAGAILGGASLTGGKGSIFGLLGGTLLLVMISNSLTLLGVQVTLVYATKGALILFAIFMDRMKEKIRIYLLHKEQLRKIHGKL